MERQRKLSKRDRPTRQRSREGQGQGRGVIMQGKSSERPVGKRERLSEVEEELLWFR